MRQKIARFMWGRYGMYGVDKFSIGLLAVYIILGFAASLVGSSAVANVIRAVQLAALFYWFFRLFSRNIAARKKENAWFSGIWNKIAAFFKLQYNRIREIKTHTYKKCPHCKAALRLPRKKGKHVVRCPRCGESFQVNNIF